MRVSAAAPRLLVLFPAPELIIGRNLMTARPNVFWLLIAGLGGLVAGGAALLWSGRRQERHGSERKIDFFSRRERLDEARRDHHHQFVRRFLRRVAAEQRPQDRDIAEPSYFV